ncbi:MAG: response regulator transcription factor [Algicola sp.]|nr:response regulator transcription factor [Algicola sp.]
MLKVLIVDDERLARVELKRLLGKIDGVEVVGEAKNANEALTALKSQDIDLAFLDIQMPEISGLELAAEIDSPEINSKVQFVFCTAFSEHAVDAFSLNAADYIVKPVNPERLQKTIERVRELMAQPTPQNPQDAQQAKAHAYLPDTHGLLLKFGHSSRIVRLHEIERFESVGNHAAVYTSSGKSFIHCALSKIEARLDPSLFFKASRSDIIRVDNIVELQSAMTSGCLLAIMASGSEIEVSRRQASALKQVFNVF